MLLTFDIGNTTIAAGVFRDQDLVRHWRIRSDLEKTPDEYGLILRNLFSFDGLAAADVGGVIISSVVPPLTPIFQELSLTLFRARAFVVGPGLRTSMPILVDTPLELGADRIAVSVAAFHKFGGPCIVVDFGTATTFDAVSARGEYLGGAIAPGVQISAEALYLRTAKLPRIEVRRPARAIGKTTVGNMQSGLYFGYLGLVERIVSEIRKELGSDARVVATGGFAELVGPDVPAISAVEPNLVLEGLRILYERNR